MANIYGYSLGEIYNQLTIPQELLKAHRLVDYQVCKAYGTIWKTESECVSDLMKLYQNLTITQQDKHK